MDKPTRSENQAGDAWFERHLISSTISCDVYDNGDCVIETRFPRARVELEAQETINLANAILCPLETRQVYEGHTVEGILDDSVCDLIGQALHELRECESPGLIAETLERARAGLCIAISRLRE